MMKKRIGSLLLSLLLCLSLLPATALATETYTITYNPADGTAANGAVLTPVTGKSAGDTINLPAQDTLTKNGYTFVGWYDGENSYLPGDTYTVTKNATLTALWTEENATAVSKVDIGSVTLDSSEPYYHNAPESGSESANTTAENANAMLVDGVLVLKNLNVESDGIHWEYSYRTQDKNDYDLVIYLLPGTENTVKNSSGGAIKGEHGNQDSDGPSLTVRGSGKLNATGSSYGIWVWKSITFEGGTQVTATGQTRSAIFNRSSAGTITVRDNNTQVTAIGESEASTTEDREKSYGVGTDFGSEGKGTLVVENGAVLTAKGATKALYCVNYNVNSLALTVSENADGSTSTQMTGESNTSLDNYKYVKITGAAAQHAHPICGASCSHTSSHTDVTWTEWTSGNTLPTESGNYYLTKDVALTASWEPAGSTISNNTASGSPAKGGGVAVADGAFIMTGGEIANNIVTSTGVATGGGVYVSNSTFTMTNGAIKNNTVTSTSTEYTPNGGGVYLDGAMTVGGKAVIQENDKGNSQAASNVYLDGNKTIACAAAPNAPEAGMCIYVDDGGSNSKDIVVNATASDAAYFHGDDTSKIVVFKEGGKLALEKATHSVSLSQTGTYTFSAATVGYEAAPDALSVTVTNTGNQPTGALTVALSGNNASNFTLSKTSIDSIAAAGTDTFTVQPNTGLSAGTYTATVTVSGGNEISANFDVTFTVNNVTPPSPSPSGGGGSSKPSTPSITVPVSSDTGSVEVKAEVSNGTATVNVSDKQIKQVASDGSGNVTVDVSDLKNVDNVKLPSAVVDKTNEADETGLTVALPDGAVTLDETSLDSVSKGDDVTISVQRVPATDLTESQQQAVGDMANIGLVVDVDLLVGNKKQSTFNGGTLTISIPYTPKKGEDTSKLTVWFIRDDGTIENKGGAYHAEKQCFIFETNHLSRYVLVSVEGIPAFTDVPADAYYAEAVTWAVLNGITTGMTETTFGPDVSCTRAQIVTMMYRL